MKINNNFPIPVVDPTRTGIFEIIAEAIPGEIYLDRDTGKPMEVVGKVLPLAPSPSRLPWSVENLRFCPWCDQLAQKDLNDCPTCERRMGPP